MKQIIKGLLLIILVSSSLVSIFSCGPAPYCETDLVTLDETRLDLVTHEEDVAKTGKEVGKIEKDLEKIDQQISKIEGKPDKLEKRIHELKKGSGRE